MGVLGFEGLRGNGNDVRPDLDYTADLSPDGLTFAVSGHRLPLMERGLRAPALVGVLPPRTRPVARRYARQLAEAQDDAKRYPKSGGSPPVCEKSLVTIFQPSLRRASDR